MGEMIPISNSHRFPTAAAYDGPNLPPIKVESGHLECLKTNQCCW